MTILEEQDLTDEQIYEWYARAMRGKINVFDNQNEIIALLARELLAQRGIDAQTYNKS
jgi:hypothetical protein|tara:strand:+ start:7950 stop:8123 length:174 start_codon:yes stop_codon:yes gene_type:complete